MLKLLSYVFILLVYFVDYEIGREGKLFVNFWLELIFVKNVWMIKKIEFFGWFFNFI